MRIVGGQARGRRIGAPKGDDTRPTADRVRESIFNILGQRFEGGAVLDLYAGSGALALEALSRGAASAVLVDAARVACEVAQKNAEALGYAARVRVVREDAQRWLRRAAEEAPAGPPFTLAFADPPYALKLGASVLGGLDALRAKGVLAAGARVVLEHGLREMPPDAAGALQLQSRRRFGDTVVSFYHVR